MDKFLIRANTSDTFVLDEIYKDGTYSKYIKDTKQDIWLDGGANIGAFSISISPFVKKIYAFEPEKENYKLLKKNKKLNKCKNIKIINKALVSHHLPHQTLYLDSENNKGKHSVYPTNTLDKCNVKAININKVLNKHSINKIKLDIEGLEYELITNINNWNNINEIIFEYHFDMIDRPVGKYNELIQLLKSNGFKLTYKKKVPKTKYWVTIVHGVKK
jgi:FkbM family methyltransferase